MMEGCFFYFDYIRVGIWGGFEGGSDGGGEGGGGSGGGFGCGGGSEGEGGPPGVEVQVGHL